MLTQLSISPGKLPVTINLDTLAAILISEMFPISVSLINLIDLIAVASMKGCQCYSYEALKNFLFSIREKHIFKFVLRKTAEFHDSPPNESINFLEFKIVSRVLLRIPRKLSLLAGLIQNIPPIRVILLSFLFKILAKSSLVWGIVIERSAINEDINT